MAPPSVLLVALLVAAGGCTSPPAPPPRQSRPSVGRSALGAYAAHLAAEKLERGPGWDGPLGRRALLAAQQLLRPTAALIGALPPLRLPPPDEPPLSHETFLLAANVTLLGLQLDGFDTIRPFALAPDGAARVVTSSSFGRLAAAIPVNISTRPATLGRSGRTHTHPLVMRAEVADCCVNLTWDCRLRPGAIREAMTGSGADLSAVRVTLVDVDVRIGGELRVRLEPAPGNKRITPPGLWVLLSKLLTRVLKHTVESAMAERIREGLSTTFTASPPSSSTRVVPGAHASGSSKAEETIAEVPGAETCETQRHRQTASRSASGEADTSGDAEGGTGSQETSEPTTL
jgi:hypothetical protein